MGLESDGPNWRLEGTRPNLARRPGRSLESMKSLFFSYLAHHERAWHQRFSFGPKAVVKGMTYLARTQNLHRMMRWVQEVNQERRHRCFAAASRTMLSPCARPISCRTANS